jgi:hypothetical protein
MIPLQVIGYLAAGSAFCIHRLYRENKRLRWQNNSLLELTAKQNEVILFFGEICERHQIQATKFEQIVIDDLLRDLQRGPQ